MNSSSGIKKMSELEAKLDRDIWITKGSRFNASRRLLRKHHASIFTIAVLSFYNISISLAPEFLGIKGNVPELSIILSVFILILSLLEANKGYNIQAERLHQNAIDLSHLYFKFVNRKKEVSLDTFINEYNQLIKNCPENHEPIDNNLFKTEHPHDFGLEKTILIMLFSRKKKPFATFKVKSLSFFFHVVLHWWQTYWLYFLLLILPVIFLHAQ